MKIGEFGEAIKYRRKELGINQLGLAELAKVSINTIYKLERGKANPSIAILIKLAEVLGLTITLEVEKNNA